MLRVSGQRCESSASQATGQPSLEWAGHYRDGHAYNIAISYEVNCSPRLPAGRGGSPDGPAEGAAAEDGAGERELAAAAVSG